MNELNPWQDSAAIWNEDTGETVGEAFGRFEGLGSEFVEAPVALALIKAGYEVWSFGYGDDPEEFVTVDSDDVEVFEEDVDEAARVWGPFRFDETLGSSQAAVRFVLAYADGWTMSPFIDPVSSYVVRTGLKALADVGITAELPRTTSILGISHVSRGG